MLWHDYVQKAPIDPFTRESCKPSASQGVPLGGMGYLMWFSYIVQFLGIGMFYVSDGGKLCCRSGSISRGFRGEFRQWQIVPGTCDASPVMTNQFSVKLYSSTYILVHVLFLVLVSN